MEFFRIFFALCLILQVLSVPVKRSADDFCTGEQNLNYQQGQSYSYDYHTDTSLYINDISDEAKSSLELKASVVVTPLGQCNYLLSLSSASLTGESIDDASSVVAQLTGNGVVFRMNSEGELDTDVKFAAGDEAWSRNIKRAMVSAFQVKSFSKLKQSEQEPETRSSVVYETDVLGKCRTTYSASADGQAQDYTLNKKKALQRCTLSTYEKEKFLGVQFVPYAQTPEFYEGRVFIEDYGCTSTIAGGLITSVECKEVSQFKPGSRGIYGVQAHVSQTLSFKGLVASSASDVSSFESASIAFEYFNAKGERVETENFSADAFVDQVCANALETGLANEHSQQFKDLVFTMRDWSAEQMVAFYRSSEAKCALAGLTASQAIVMAKNDNSVEAALSLIDQDAFESQKYITEYPVLTALARNPNPSLATIEKFKSYLAGKTDAFDYYNKLSLVYSTLVRTHCKENECSKAQLNEFSSVFAQGVEKCDVVALKAVGNIGGFANPPAMAACAQADKSVEQQVAVMESTRNFKCEDFENAMDKVSSIFTDGSRDTEVRIAAFLAIVRCSETSEKVNQFSAVLADFLLAEEDQQVISFVIDYGKEHGLTKILNPVLNDPRVRAKFAVNFKTTSWNNFKYTHDVLKDAGIEVETSVIYTPQTWVPRSIRFNLTTHAFGASVNWMEANLRLEGLDEVLKAAIVDKLTSPEIVAKLTKDPEQLLDILKIVADKLQYKKEAAKLTFSIRVYGADIFYSRLDSKDEFMRLAAFLRSPRETILYRQVETIKNIFVIDTEIRQPLLNGLSFNRYLDISASALLSKASSKQQGENGLEYHVNNFWSGSLDFRGVFDVAVNGQNKVSLKKKSFGNARLRLNVEGSKKEGSYKYNMHLSPMETIPLVTVDGQFYKLGKNSVYQKVTEFKTTRKVYTKCNTDAFQETFAGLQLCVSVNRPEFGSLRRIMNYRRHSDLEEDFQAFYADLADDEFEADNSDNLNRPTIFLAGPYHYELKLNNPELVKTVVFDLDFDREETKSDVTLLVSTVSQSGAEVKRGELAYSRQRLMTYKGYHGKLNLKLTNLQTNDVRLNFQMEGQVHPGRVFKFHFEVENKILRPFHHKLLVNRDKTKDTIVPVWDVEVLHESERRGPKRYNLKLELTPEGRDITGQFFLEARNDRTQQQLFRPVEGRLAFISQSDSAISYTVEITGYNKLRDAELKITGDVFYSMFNSDVNLLIDYKNYRTVFPEPANIKLGHMIDLRPGAKSNMRFHVKHALRGIDHGVVMTFSADPQARKLNYLEFEISKPGLAQPASLFFEKTETDEGNTYTRDVKFGIRNINRQLSSGLLIKVDGDETLRSLVFHATKVHVRGKSIDAELSALKNGNVFVVIKRGVFGELAKVRASVDELSKTSFGANLYVKVLENSGAVSAQLDLEASKSAKTHAGAFSFKTENLFKILSKLASVEAKMSSAPGQFNAQIEYKKLGEVKSFKLFSTSGLRFSGSKAEFDIGYEKRLASGHFISGSGTGSFTFDNFKNFELAANVPGHYWSTVSVKNTRSASQANQFFGFHDFKLENAHLDYEKTQNRFRVYIEDSRAELVGKLNLLVDLRNGPLDLLENREALNIFQQVSTMNTFARGSLFISKNSLNAKSARFNIDFEKKSDFIMDPRDGKVKYDASTSLKAPAFLTAPGQLIFVKHDLSVKFDPANKALAATNNYNTNSMLFGRIVRVFNAEFGREINHDTDMVNGNLKIDYNRPSWGTEETKQWNFNFKHDLHKKSFREALAEGWKAQVRVQQNRFPEFHSRLLLPGQTFTIADCLYDETVVRSKLSDSYSVDLDASLRCDGALIKHGKLSVKTSGWKSGSPSSRLEYSSKSDYHPDRLFKLAHDKFSAKHGLIAVGFNRDSNRTVFNEFVYDRSVSETDKKAHYRLTTSFGDELSKVCDVNFQKTADNGFLNLDCRLNTTKYPGRELGYGFNAQSLNLQQRMLGNRNYEVKLFVPGRTLKFEYERNYPSYFDGNDDDEDANNEREFNATAKFYWDETKDKSKFIQVIAKRDNYAVGKSTTFVEFVNTPHFESLKFSADKSRTFNETNVLLKAEYLMKNGAANKLTVNGILKSDLDTNSLSIETNLDRPSFNTKYENRFNKWNGKLDFLGIRIGKVLKLTIDKESQQGQRMISMNLVNPDESRYTFEGTSNLNNDVYTVEGSLSEAGKKLSNVVSKFDAKNNVFTVVVKGLATGNNYKFNFGVFSETIADASVLDLNTNKYLGKTSVRIAKSDMFDEPELVVNMRWNRFWRQVISDIQGGNDEGLAAVNSGYNSYFGDVYATVTEDLKPVVVAHRNQRKLVKQDFTNLVMLLADFYTNYLDAEKKAAFDRFALQQASNALSQMESQQVETPIYKKVLRTYNKVAQSLTVISMKARRINKRLSRFVPRLPTYEYNEVESEFQNNLVVRRPTLNAKNFYQFNQEYRDYLRKAGANFLKVKGNLVRSNLGGMGIKALVNKYKYRSLSDYTVVGHVFNKRNMIGFDGEAVVLQSRCRYLLAHETKRNSFSVILNFEKKDKQDFPISVHAYGSKSVDIGYDRAAIDDVNVALPHVMPLGEDNGFLSVTRHADSVCVEVNKDLKVCCYDDSKSCTVATTRWFKGRLNGLLGKADSDADTIDQQDWYLSNRCRYPNARSRKSSDEAERTCYGLFGRHRAATFKNALQAVNPDSWRSVCESVLTASIKYKCVIIRAFVHHAQVMNVHVNVPNDCMYCKIGSNNYAVGQSVPAYAAGYESNFASGSDVVLVKLPCNRQNGVDMEGVKQSIGEFLENPENRYYVVSASNKAVSVVQSADGKDYNVDLSTVKLPEQKESVDKETFIKAMYTAGSLLTQRLAQHRHIVVESCGNSMSYKLNSLFFLRKLNERNVVVHSVGDYNIKNLDWEEKGVSIYGYGYKQLFQYYNDDEEADNDDLAAFNIDHTLDMPARLAVKTGGLVLVREGKYAAHNLNLILNENPKTYTYKVGTCERLDSLYGDLTDFKYTRKEQSSNYFEEDY